MKTEPGNRNSLRDKTILALLLIILLPVLLVVALVYLAETIILYLSIWIAWSLHGRRVLLVYSNSPLWKDYFEAEILPALSNLAVVLNWSDRKQWKISLAVLALKHFAGDHDFNPIAIVFRPFHFAKSFRFYQAFREFKHGRPEPVELIRMELFSLLHVQRKRSGAREVRDKP